MRNGLPRVAIVILGLTPIAAALPASAGAAAPGLPRTYVPQAIDSPQPRAGGSFGWGIASADLTGDGKPDLLVAQSQDPTSSQIFIFDGATGKNIDTIKPPELNPDANPDPVLGFVYIETMPDLGSCPGGKSSQICPNATVGPPDGIPEILVGARALRVNATNDAAAPTTADPALGRGYVLDGATRAVLKRIDMPPADRLRQAALGAAPQFGRVMISPQAMPPCAGSAAENNNVGVGPCPPVPLSTRIGDLNGDGIPDILITARNYVETTGPAASAGPDAAASTSQCAATPATTPVTKCTSGKAWAYSGAAIAGSDPRAILDTAMYSIQDPLSQTTGEEFGGNLYRVGDLNSSITSNCAVPPFDPSCAPEFVIPARNLGYPLLAPSIDQTGVGAAFVFDGATGKPINTPSGLAITSPEPQKLSQFSGSFNGGRAVGDLGASTLPDILLPAALQNGGFTDEGRMWAFNGVGGGGGATGSWQFATLTDPTPHTGGTFGGSFTGVGNLVDGPSAPSNEVLVGGFHFDTFTETTNSTVESVHFMNVQTNTNLMTIKDPDTEGGDGFGVGLVPMGDLNGDGYLDFAVSAYLADVTTGGDGRAFIFRSDNSPLPQPPAVTPPATPAAPAAAVAFKTGSCANSIVGTEQADTLFAPLAPATIGFSLFGLGGNDVIHGGAGTDCIDGGAGDDTLRAGTGDTTIAGGPGNDTIYGGPGKDKLYGQDGDDRIYAGSGDSLLSGDKGRDLLVGGAGTDQLFGGPGNDILVAGSGAGYLDGGSGNDVIYARNGKRDSVNCGPGEDVAVVDRTDRIVNCEHVLYSTATPRGASALVRDALGRLRHVLQTLGKG